MTKYSDNIPDEKIEQVIEGTVTPEQVAEEVNVPVSAVHNKKSRTIAKKKLSVGFSGAKPDNNLPNEIKGDNQQDNAKTDQVPLDATEALKGFWSLIDMILSMGSFLTQGQFEYEKLKPEDINGLAQVSNNNETMRKIATVQGADMMIILGYAGMKFAPRIKLNKYPKHNEDKAKNKKCKCEECTKLAQEEKDKKGKTDPTMQKTFTEVKSEIKPEEKVETTTHKSKEDELREILQRNLGSDPKSLKDADNYIEKMKSSNDRGLRITD